MVTLSFYLRIDASALYETSKIPSPVNDKFLLPLARLKLTSISPKTGVNSNDVEAFGCKSGFKGDGRCRGHAFNTHYNATSVGRDGKQWFLIGQMEKPINLQMMRTSLSIF